MVNYLLYRAWLTKELLRKGWKGLPRGRKWGISWLVFLVLFILVIMPWKAVAIISVIVGFVTLMIVTVWALLAAFDV